MTKLLLLSAVIFLFSCNQKNNDQSNIAGSDILIEDTVISSEDSERINSESKVPNHDLQFSDTIIHSTQKITIDTIISKIDFMENLVGYKLNPSNNEILRLYGNNEKSNKSINGLFLNGKSIVLDSQLGTLDEFNGEHLFFNVWKGGGIEGTITKTKYRIEDQSLIFIDSLKGGVYSEGAGTWEWLIGDHGEAIGILNPDDQWFMTSDHLLINSFSERFGKIFLINYLEGDTLLQLNLTERGINDLLYDGNNIFLHTHGLGRLNYLEAYDLDGSRIWKNNTGYLERVISDTVNNVIIAHGYYHTGTPHKNSIISYTICFDSKTGEIKWDFPTSKTINVAHVRASNLFVINNNLFGIILGKPEGYKTFSDNKLIVFNISGEIVQELNLSSSSQNYSVVKLKEGVFQLVGIKEETLFKIAP